MISNPNKIFDELSLVLTDETRTKIMTTADRLRQEGKYEGKVEGKQEALEQVVLTLVEMDKPISEIAKITKLPIEKIKKLREEKEKH